MLIEDVRDVTAWWESEEERKPLRRWVELIKMDIKLVWSRKMQWTKVCGEVAYDITTLWVAGKAEGRRRRILWHDESLPVVDFSFHNWLKERSKLNYLSPEMYDISWKRMVKNQFQLWIKLLLSKLWVEHLIGERYCIPLTFYTYVFLLIFRLNMKAKWKASCLY